MNVVKQHLLVGFDEDTQADEFLARDKVKVEHDKLHHLKELHLQHNTTSTREKVEIEHYKLHREKVTMMNKQEPALCSIRTIQSV